MPRHSWTVDGAVVGLYAPLCLNASNFTSTVIIVAQTANVPFCHPWPWVQSFQAPKEQLDASKDDLVAKSYSLPQHCPQGKACARDADPWIGTFDHVFL